MTKIHAVVAAAVMLAPIAHAQTIEIIEGAPGDVVTPIHISRDGRHVSGDLTPLPLRHFLWTRGGTVRTSPPPPGWATTSGGKVSNTGIALGMCWPGSSSVPDGFIWDGGTHASLMRDAVKCATCPTVPRDISPDGTVIVGEMHVTWALGRGFSLVEGSLMVMDTLGTSGSHAQVISGDKQVIFGTVSTSGPDQAFRWTEATGMELLPEPSQRFEQGYVFTSANKDGSIAVGYDAGFWSVARALRWNGTSAPISLRGFADASWSVATGLTDDGSIVVGLQIVNGQRVSCVWTDRFLVEAKAFLTGLGFDFTGWSHVEIADVNDDGTAFCGQGTFNGQPTAFAAYLTPPCAADYDHAGGGGDILDLLTFFDDYSECENAAAPCGAFGNADVNGDTVVDILDFLAFLAAAEEGC